jgi:vacuolar-type H+-ATPase subunit I/STV1
VNEGGTTQREARQDSGVLDLANLAEVGEFMNRVFSKPEAQDRFPVQSANLQRHLEEAVEPECAEVDMLLSKAAKAIEFLSSRCQILEHELSDRAEQLVEHERASTQWMQFSTRLQAQAAADQNRLAELAARAEAAEARVMALESDASEANERSVAADARSTVLHGKVLAAFGRKSSIHSVLQAVSLQEAAE